MRHYQIYNFLNIVCQVLPIFPRLVDLPIEKFQTALARILQVLLEKEIVILICIPFLSLEMNCSILERVSW